MRLATDAMGVRLPERVLAMARVSHACVRALLAIDVTRDLRTSTAGTLDTRFDSPAATAVTAPVLAMGTAPSRFHVETTWRSKPCTTTKRPAKRTSRFQSTCDVSR